MITLKNKFYRRSSMEFLYEAEKLEKQKKTFLAHLQKMKAETYGVIGQISLGVGLISFLFFNTPQGRLSTICKSICVAVGFGGCVFSNIQGEEPTHPKIVFSVSQKKFSSQKLGFTDQRFINQKTHENHIFLRELCGAENKKLPLAKVGKPSYKMSSFKLISID